MYYYIHIPLSQIARKLPGRFFSKGRGGKKKERGGGGGGGREKRDITPPPSSPCYKKKSSHSHIVQKRIIKPPNCNAIYMYV